MILKIIPLVLAITVDVSRCSLVIDSIAQKGIHLSDYCPNMKYCKEGSHVMCVYYDPNRPMGPTCSNFVNVTMTTDLACQQLDVINAIRSKIATGKETGKDGVVLPRGYGIFRLKWDNELATFAQVLANQCLLRHDLCRATRRFPDPGQTVGLVRFTFPDWYPLSRKTHSSVPGLTESKMSYAITQTLKSWYAQKASVTESMVRDYPDWTLTPNNQGGRLYLEMIYASATHMGCGMSAYAEYSYYQSHRQMTYNSILVVCNFSSRPRKGSQSYETEKPGIGFSANCGCPEGTIEDQDCLCIDEVQSTQQLSNSKPCNADGTGNCEPTLVLLPIFTVEDAPSNKLVERAQDIKDPLKNFILQRIDNNTTPYPVTYKYKQPRSRQSLEILDFFDEAEREDLFKKPAQVPHPLKTVLMASSDPSSEVIYRAPLPPPIFPTKPATSSTPSLPPRPTRPPPPPPPTPPLDPPPPPPRVPPPPPPVPPANSDQLTEVMRARYDPAQIDEIRRSPTHRHLPRHPPVTKKSSIFTRVAQFKLPGRRSMSPPFVKKDVPPRKDFSNLHKVVNDYLKRRPEYRRNNKIASSHNIDNRQEDEDKSQEVKLPQETVTEAVLHKVEEKVMNYNQYLKQKTNITNHHKDIDIKDDNDNKLMSLLDTLEREVKHIELDGSEKEIFDAKIRKIYGTVVGKPTDLIPARPALNDPEVAEIDIGEPKHGVRREPEPAPNYDETEDLKSSAKRNEVERKNPRSKNYDYLISHKRKDKIVDNIDFKKMNDKIDQNGYSDIDRKPNEIFDHKYKDNFEHKYNGNEHKYVEDLDRRYNENLDRKYSENNLERKYDAPHKFNNNFERKYHENLERKYEDVHAPRNLAKYDVTKDLAEFREFKHNGLSSLEDVKYRNFDKYIEKDVKIGRGSPDRNPYRSKNSERKHRSRVEGKSTKNFHSHNNGHNDLDDPLSIERRKYYQEKLENIERKLRGSRNYRRRNDPRNDRPMRRMRPNRDGLQRSRSKSQADSFYMPERARFLHGF